MNTRETTNVNQGHITDVGYYKEPERVAHDYNMKITNVKVENDYMYIVLFPEECVARGPTISLLKVR